MPWHHCPSGPTNAHARSAPIRASSRRVKGTIVTSPGNRSARPSRNISLAVSSLKPRPWCFASPRRRQTSADNPSRQCSSGGKHVHHDSSLGSTTPPRARGPENPDLHGAAIDFSERATRSPHARPLNLSRPQNTLPLHKTRVADTGVAQGQHERLLVLVVGVFRHLHRDRLLRFAGNEGERPNRLGVVLACRCRPVRGRVVDHQCAPPTRGSSLPRIQPLPPRHLRSGESHRDGPETDRIGSDQLSRSVCHHTGYGRNSSSAHSVGMLAGRTRISP